MRTSQQLLTVFFLTGTLFAAPPKFQTREAIELVNGIVTLGDINGDGRADIVTALPTPGSTNNDYEVSIQLNTGSGLFTQSQTVDLGPNFVLTAIVTGDFNKDGLLDIAVFSASSQSLYILLQQANGFIAEPIQVANQSGTTLNMAVGDVNGDHLPDILIPSSSGVLLLLNTGSGHFATPVLATTVPSQFVILADLNGDKKLDLAVSTDGCCTGTTIILLGDGHGGFDGPLTQPSLYNPSPRFAVADLNGDGKLDIAAVSQNSGGISILLGNGDGTFQAPAVTPFPGQFLYGASVSTADLNGDGLADIVALSTSTNYSGYTTAMVIYINAGSGTFGAPAVYPVQSQAAAALIGNLNSDRFPDVLITSAAYQTNVISVLFNNGKGIFQDGILETTTSAPQFLVTGDFNGDGKLDLAELNGAQGLTMFLNDGINASPFTALAPLPYYSGPMVAGDFNNDGRLDLVVVNYQTAQTLLGNGDGTFFYQPPSFNTGPGGPDIVAADMNGDGKLDLITGSPAILLGAGNGTFAAPITNPYYTCYGPGTVAVADFNKDGKPDVVSICSGSIDVFLGNGDGTLQFPTAQFYESDLQSIAVGDFNRDGIADIAFTSNPNFYLPASTEVTILVGNGDGTFRTGSTTLALSESSGLLIASDFNGDGILDLAVLDNFDSVYSILQGNGDGTFRPARLFGTATNPTCMVKGLFQTPVRKGFPDLAFCSGPGVALDINTTQ